MRTRGVAITGIASTETLGSGGLLVSAETDEKSCNGISLHLFRARPDHIKNLHVSRICFSSLLMHHPPLTLSPTRINRHNGLRACHPVAEDDGYTTRPSESLHKCSHILDMPKIAAPLTQCIVSSAAIISPTILDCMRLCGMFVLTGLLTAVGGGSSGLDWCQPALIWLSHSF